MHLLAGVTYIESMQLPGSTMTFRGVQMVIEDSSFIGLQSFGGGALAFANSNVTVLNSTFFNNNNSAGELSIITLSACKIVIVALPDS